MNILTVETPGELAALLAGRSDDEVCELAAGAGYETTVARMFSLMAGAFLPERAPGVSAVAQWEITAPDGPHTFTIIIEDGTCRSVAGPADSPRVSLSMGLPDFLRFMGGEGKAITAFMAGKLKVTGDVMFGPVMENYFQRT